MCSSTGIQFWVWTRVLSSILVISNNISNVSYTWSFLIKFHRIYHHASNSLEKQIIILYINVFTFEKIVVLMMELIRSYLRGLKVLIRTWTRMKWRLLWLKKFSTAHFTASWLFLSSSIAIAVIPCFSSTSDKFGRNKAMEDAWKHWEN